MKNLFSFVLILALMLTLAAAASADPMVLYAAHDGVRVYAETNTASQVYKTLPQGDPVLIEQSASGWYATLVEDPAGGQTLGWIQAADLVTTPPCSHSWGPWTVQTAATCTEKGVQISTCTMCGETQTQAIEKIPHSYGDWIVRRSATCTQTGEMFRTCKVCGVEQTQVIEKLPHDYGDWTVRRAPTCTREGERVHWCKACGAEQTKAIDKVPHTYGDWTVLREPTCVQKGERGHWCTVCGHEETEKIPKLPHDFGPWEVTVETTDHSAGQRQRVCQYCGETEKESFDPEGTLRRKAKGDAVREIQQLLADQGYLKKKGVDGSYGSGTETAIKLFQKDQGLVPDGVAWPQTIEALRHEFGAWEMVTELSRFSDGEDMRVCAKCGFEEHVFTKAEPSLRRGDKGKGVRCVQELLTALGYECGKIDSSYGGKLEKAWEAFAADHELDIEIDRIRPGDLDVLVNTWIDALPEENWMGQGDKDSPVNLILTITPAGSEDGLYRYDWEVSNLGSKDCRLVALLLGYGDDRDFTADNLVLVMNSASLKADGGKSRSGSFTVAADWAQGASPVYVCAVGCSEASGAVWTSNPVACSLDG